MQVMASIDAEQVSEQVSDKIQLTNLAPSRDTFAKPLNQAVSPDRSGTKVDRSIEHYTNVNLCPGRARRTPI